MVLFQVVEQVMDFLSQLVQHLIGQSSDLANQMLYLVARIFLISNSLQLCPCFMQNNQLDPWVSFFKSVLEKDIPQEWESPTEDVKEIQKREKLFIWKLKGVSAEICEKLFMKYGNSQFCSPTEKEFSNFFNKTYSVPLLQSCLSLMFRKKTHFVGAKALNFSLKFVENASHIKATQDELFGLVDNILYESVVPIIARTHQDIA